MYPFSEQIFEARRLAGEDSEELSEPSEDHEHTILLSQELGLSLQPCPITKENFIDLGGFVPELFEDGFTCLHVHHPKDQISGDLEFQHSLSNHTYCKDEIINRHG